MAGVSGRTKEDKRAFWGLSENELIPRHSKGRIEPILGNLHLQRRAPHRLRRRLCVLCQLGARTRRLRLRSLCLGLQLGLQLGLKLGHLDPLPLTLPARSVQLRLVGLGLG